MATEDPHPSRSFDFSTVSHPDELVRAQALRLHRELIKPVGSLGKLEELSAWVAACQGHSPPRPFTRPRVVIFAGDHGISAKGVSAFPQEATGQLFAAMLDGVTATNSLANAAGASVRTVNVGMSTETMSNEHKIRDSTGSLDVEDALTEAEVRAAIAVGIDIADSEVDSGADLLIAGDLGVANTTAASILVAAVAGGEPVAVVGRGSGIDDSAWMRKTVAIRDGLRRARKVTGDPLALLQTVGGTEIAALAGFLAQAAQRRTPVLLDGFVVGAAALLADELAPNARAWWVASQQSPEPAHELALRHLDIDPILDLGVGLGQGASALIALPLLTMAVRVLAETSTYEQAGVSRPAPGLS